MRLAGMTALVTGGGRGIGRSIALRFAGEGAAVGLIARSQDELDAVASEIRDCGGRAVTYAADLGCPGQAVSAYDAVVGELGPIDVLVNNAGVCRVAAVTELSDEDWDVTMAVNVRAMFVLCRAVLPGMKKRRRGVIINVSSRGGRAGFPMYSSYCASKFAVIGFSESLAAEVCHDGIRVNCICPGEVDTVMNRASHPGIEDTSHWLTPDDVADVALFLAGGGSRGVLGTAVEVYGLSYMPGSAGS